MVKEHNDRIVRAITATQLSLGANVSGTNSCGDFNQMRQLRIPFVPVVCPVTGHDLFGAPNSVGLEEPDSQEGEREWGHQYGYPGCTSAQELLDRVSQVNWQLYRSYDSQTRNWTAFTTPDLSGWCRDFITLEDLLQTDLANSLRLLYSERTGRAICSLGGVVHCFIPVDCSTVILTSSRTEGNAQEVFYSLHPGSTLLRKNAKYRGRVSLSDETKKRGKQQGQFLQICVSNVEATQLGFTYAQITHAFSL